MVQSLKDITASAAADYFKAADYGTWVAQWPGQVVMCSKAINWTAETTEAIERSTLEALLHRMDRQVQEMVQLVRAGTSSRALRTTLQALIVLDLHSRNVVETLINNQVSSPQDFGWSSNMRYYLVTKQAASEEGRVQVSMISTTVDYGFEYLGNCSRLVVTHVTERCLRTMMIALQLRMGAALSGPPGSGKTETCKVREVVVPATWHSHDRCVLRCRTWPKPWPSSA